ncbi:MAG: copper oxidase [Hyphomicrobiales bacterium]|nr:MAG: copper oxidase [Hyphomicrobiales bacterium]
MKPAGDSLEGDWGALSALPGNPMMWLLIWSELFVFGAAFAGFSVARILDMELFAQSQATLDRLAGAINTMVLITSGFMAALAVNAQSRDRSGQARAFIGGAIVLGLVFLVIKFFEYSDKFAHGIGIETNNFYTLYFLLTGFHAAHVVLGIVILAIVAWKNSLENLETGAAFWHMVDLIWVILFPLIFLMR